MSAFPEFPALLSSRMVPPSVLGTAALTAAAYQGTALEELGQMIVAADEHPAARSFDRSILHQLALRRDEAMGLQRTALEGSTLFRIVDGSRGAIRLLAIMAPGDLMVNTPLDFITAHLDVGLDILFVVPGRPLPPVIPDHDIAFMAVSEADPALHERLRALYASWPRPILNDPALLPAMARDRLPRLLAGVPGLCSPMAAAVDAAKLRALRDDPGWLSSLLPGASFPVLLRPAGSHAGAGLVRADGPAQVAEFVERTPGNATITQFADYRSPDGLYRKYRIALIDRKPYLCHLAISSHWMVHYLNGGMTESAEKRAIEAAAMADFDNGFARRHAGALQAICDQLDFDVFSIDCGELPDGRLILFEADTAAIIHAMDAPELFPYKRPQMDRVFDAFGQLLQRRVVDFAEL